MDTRQIRRQNLLRLLNEIGRNRLAKLAGTAPEYLSQLKSKRTRADIGHDLARRLEHAMKKPRGWMDIPHENEDIEMISKALMRIDKKLLVAILTMVTQAAPETAAELDGVLGRIDPSLAKMRSSEALDELEHEAAPVRRRKSR